MSGGNGAAAVVRPGDDRPPDVTICIPHFQVKELMQLCLRAIRRYTTAPAYEVIVVDNGSRDESLDWLRSVGWVRLVERGDETPENWVLAMSTALDRGLALARGRYYLILHSDTIVKSAAWLPSLVALLEENERVASAGSGKLERRGAVARLLRSATDFKRLRIRFERGVLRKPFDPVRHRALLPREGCPRDYCAIYRTEVLREHGLSFVQKEGYTAGETVYRDLKSLGYETRILPVERMMELVDHIAHATGAILPDRELEDRRVLRKTRRKLRRLFARGDVEDLLADASLDR